MSQPVDGLDLHAAFMRRAAADQPAFLEALAVRLEQALPGRVQVLRKKDGLFAKTAHVRSITVDTGDARYSLENESGLLHAHRARATNGVVLKRDLLSVPQWLDALSEALARLSSEAEGAQRILHDFLMS